MVRGWTQKNEYIPLALGVAAVLVIASLVAVFAARPAGAPRTLPDVTLTDFDGNTVALDEAIAGRLAVINAWASWCPFCTRELPDFTILQDEFEGRIVVIAVNRKEKRSEARAYMQKHDVSPDDLLMLFDEEDAFYKAIQGFAMPETIIVDESGTIVFHKRGPMTLEEMRATVHAVLSGISR